MKTATDKPEDGRIIQPTTTLRVLPASAIPKQPTTTEFWSYIEAMTPEDWERSMV